MTRACVAVAAVLVTGALGATGCTSFSSYQTARMLAPRQLSVGGAVAVATHYRGVATPEVPPGVQGRAVLVEGLARFGVTDRLEAGLKLGYAHSFGDFELSLEQAFVDAKLSLLPDQLAVALPVGGTLIDGEAFDLQTQPGLIWTATLAAASSSTAPSSWSWSRPAASPAWVRWAPPPWSACASAAITTASSCTPRSASTSPTSTRTASPSATRSSSGLDSGFSSPPECGNGGPGGAVFPSLDRAHRLDEDARRR